MKKITPVVSGPNGCHWGRGNYPTTRCTTHPPRFWRRWFLRNRGLSLTVQRNTPRFGCWGFLRKGGRSPTTRRNTPRLTELRRMVLRHQWCPRTVMPRLRHYRGIPQQIGSGFRERSIFWQSEVHVPRNLGLIQLSRQRRAHWKVEFHTTRCAGSRNHGLVNLHTIRTPLIDGVIVNEQNIDILVTFYSM